MYAVRCRNRGEIRMGSPFRTCRIALTGGWVPELPAADWQDLFAVRGDGQAVALVRWDTAGNVPGFRLWVVDGARERVWTSGRFPGCCRALVWATPSALRWEAFPARGGVFRPGARTGEATEIRKAEASDLKRMGRLWKEFIDVNAEGDARFERARDGHLPWERAAREALHDPERLLLVAEERGTPVGFVSAALGEHPPMLASRRHGFLKELAVTETARGRGVGAALCAAAEGWLRERGARAVELHVASSNPVSMAFWEAMGYGTFLVRMGKTLGDERPASRRGKKGSR